MGYGREVYESAERILQGRRRHAEEESQRRKAAFFDKFPQAAEIEHRLASTAVSAARAVLAGKDAGSELNRIRTENQALQARFSGLLQKYGVAEDYLEPHYTCPQCSDTGYRDGRMCSCLKNLLREEACRRLNMLTPLSLSTFDSFSLGYYSEKAEPGKASDREIMQRTFRFCKSYAATFSTQSPNLIMTGGTGLGKTHLSLAIANEAIQKGFGVIYGSAGNLIAKLENEHFGREENGDTARLLQDCDLLILDDLGTEFKSSFSSSAVYGTVNTRLMMQKPTIISTNLSTREMMTGIPSALLHGSSAVTAALCSSAAM